MWEYKILHISDANEARLNELGALKWELVGVQGGRVYMKRKRTARSTGSGQAPRKKAVK